MSKAAKIVYNIDDVNKKILAKAPHIHFVHEFLSAQYKYRDEDYEIYKLKRQQFYEAAQKYRDLNKAALFNNNSKLDKFCIDILRYDDECECEALPRVNVEEVEACCLESWFKRYLKLCKFIYAARGIILKNRLMKNLAILRELDNESVAAYEDGHRKFENVSYAHIFEKFIQ